MSEVASGATGETRSGEPEHHDVCSQCGGRQVTLSPLGARLQRVLGVLGSVLAWPLVALVRAYQLLISPLTPPSCRYYPSCSSYALTSLRRFGPLKGGWLAVRRILRCHPWAAGGVDYVPDAPHTCSCAVPPNSESRSVERSRRTTDKDRR